MQDTMRDAMQVAEMIQYIQDGGLWTQDRIKAHADTHNRRAASIYISRFPEDVKMIHDGHHRIVATYLGGRSELQESEYDIGDWTYESYKEVNFNNGFVTPFDPVTEVRLDNFFSFKVEALRIAQSSREEAKTYISTHKHLYARPRRLKTVHELALEYMKVLRRSQVAIFLPESNEQPNH